MITLDPQEFHPKPGCPLPLAEDIALVLAPNPGPMTYLGTNSYLLGRDALVVIDPGPDDPAHLAALINAIAGRPVSHILVTHSHRDHSPLAPALGRAVDAPVMAFGDSKAGQSLAMQALARRNQLGGGEGVDNGFQPDRLLRDGEVLSGPWGQITALHTPGHMGNHMCFESAGRLFCGDLIMGWASSLVSPPDGDLTAFLASCQRVQALAPQLLLPGHGAPVSNPAARISWLLEHRAARSAQIIAALQTGPATPAALTARLYADVDPTLWPAAARNVLAHLIALCDNGELHASPEISPQANYALTGE